MSRWAWIAGVAGLWLVAGLGNEARASLVDEWLSIRELVERSDGIFIGEVQDGRSQWDGRSGEICTLVTLEVQSELKGRADSDGTIHLRVPGGRVGSVMERVVGAARFAPGEHVLVFAARDQEGFYRVTGMAQGKYTIRQDSYSGIQFAVSDGSGLRRLVADGDGSYRAEEASSREVLLTVLIQAIEEHTRPALVMR